MLAIGSDHGGYDLKQEIKAHLKERGIEFEDLGVLENTSCDYPDFGAKVAKAVLAGDAELGILICGTGIGISIAANRFKGIRCANCTSEYMAKMAKEHNNANILALGGRILTGEEACRITDVFLDTPFSDGERHIRRIEKLDSLN